MKTKITLFLSDAKVQALESLQDEYLTDSLADTVRMLIWDKYKNIDSNKKRKDRRTPDTDELAIYDHPEQIGNPGVMLTLGELKGWYSLQDKQIPEDMFDPDEVRTYVDKIEKEMYPNQKK